MIFIKIDIISISILIVLNYILGNSNFRMRYDCKSALVIWFSFICEYSFLATSNSKSKNDVEVSYSNNFTKRNESDCFGCEDLTKNRTAPSVVKFQV